MQDTINTDKDTENKNYMEKCKLTKTATPSQEDGAMVALVSSPFSRSTKKEDFYPYWNEHPGSLYSVRS